MKYVFPVLATVALAACTAEEPASEETTTEEPAVEEVAGPGSGVFETEDPDGNVATWTIAEDGSFTAVGADGEGFSGNFVKGEEGQNCIDFADDEEGPVCFTETEPGEDGSWTATNPDGVTNTVRRVGDLPAEDAEG